MNLATSCSLASGLQIPFAAAGLPSTGDNDFPVKVSETYRKELSQLSRKCSLWHAIKPLTRPQPSKFRPMLGKPRQFSIREAATTVSSVWDTLRCKPLFFCSTKSRMRNRRDDNGIEASNDFSLVKESTVTLGGIRRATNTFFSDFHSHCQTIFNAVLLQDYGITLPPHYSSVYTNESNATQHCGIDLSSFLLNLPGIATPIIKHASPEALADRLLPASIIPSCARRIAVCFWAWLCVLDGK